MAIENTQEMDGWTAIPEIGVIPLEGASCGFVVKPDRDVVINEACGSDMGYLAICLGSSVMNKCGEGWIKHHTNLP